MRKDQLERLKSLEEKLVDVYLTEADPDLWQGATVPIEEWTKEIRGDRYWAKKNGVATIALAIRTISLIGMVNRNAIPNIDGNNDADSELDSEIEQAEKEAKKLMQKLTDKTAKANFDKKVHG